LRQKSTKLVMRSLGDGGVTWDFVVGLMPRSVVAHISTTKSQSRRRTGFALPTAMMRRLVYARTWDDEGLLGTGASVLGGAGYRVGDRCYHYTLMPLTASGGIDVTVSPRASILASVRFYGLLQTGCGRDLAPHRIIAPGIGIAWRT
jgi:hypothetical protein